MWEFLLNAVLSAGIGILVKAGFEDKVRDLKKLIGKETATKRRKAFDQALKKARAQAGEKSILPLLEHRPFIDEVLTGLLDPEHSFDVQAASKVWRDKLPEHARTLRRFFNALEQELLADETWGPLLERFNNVRSQREIKETLKQQQIELDPQKLVAAVSSQLQNKTENTQIQQAIKIDSGGVYVEGSLFGDVVQHVIENLTLHVTVPAESDTEKYQQIYLKELARKANNLPWTSIDPEFTDPQRGENPGLVDVYTALDSTALEISATKLNCESI